MYHVWTHGVWARLSLALALPVFGQASFTHSFRRKWFPMRQESWGRVPGSCAFQATTDSVSACHQGQGHTKAGERKSLKPPVASVVSPEKLPSCTLLWPLPAVLGTQMFKHSSFWAWVRGCEF